MIEENFRLLKWNITQPSSRGMRVLEMAAGTKHIVLNNSSIPTFRHFPQKYERTNVPFCARSWYLYIYDIQNFQRRLSPALPNTDIATIVEWRCVQPQEADQRGFQQLLHAQILVAIQGAIKTAGKRS